MLQTDFSLYTENPANKVYIPALVGAGVCLLLVRSVILSFFFLVPLGFLAYRYEYRIAWVASVFAIMGNAVLLIGGAISQGFPMAAITWNFLHFTLMVLIFAWIVAPSPVMAVKVSLSVRFLSGCCIGALAFIGFFIRIMAAPGFPEYISNMMNSLVLQNVSFGVDAETLLQGMMDIILRGGSLVTCVLLFMFCRQMSLLFARAIPGKTRNSAGEPLGLYLRRMNSLEAFNVAPIMIWVFSVSLFLIVVIRILGLEIPEIILWNILILCAILYLAQGIGILQFFLARPTISPFMKLFFLALLFVLLFSPFLNGILLIGLVLLGIAENWVPFRALKQNSPPSTPESEQ